MTAPTDPIDLDAILPTLRSKGVHVSDHYTVMPMWYQGDVEPVIESLIAEHRRLLADNERLREALRVAMSGTVTSSLAHHAARDALTQGDPDGQ